ALPIFLAPDLLVASASYGIGALAIRVRADEAGTITTEEVWQSNVLRTHFNSSVLIDGKIYGFDNATLKCIDPTTGEALWAQRRGLGKGSLIAADGRLIVLTENGTLKIVEATPEKYHELASHPVLTGRSWTEPTLADGRVYLRNREEIVALDLRGAGATTTTSAATSSPSTDPSTATTKIAHANLDLAEIRRRHADAVGDLATIHEARGLRIRGTYDAEGNLWPYTLTISHAGAYRLEVAMDRGVGLEASNGTTAWIDDPGDEPAKLLPADQAAWAIADLATFATPWLATLDEGTRLELVGTADLDGRPAYHLRAHVAEDRTEDWYLDPQDFLVRRKDVKANIEWLGDYTRVYWFHRYGEHRGVRLPHFTERVDETFVKLFHVESVDTLEQIDPAIFEAPANAEAPEPAAADAR
ncbi:MAG: PQQ-binding-like beta-propeller repeat protein, partial [Acidobacteriota bacterium]